MQSVHELLPNGDLLLDQLESSHRPHDQSYLMLYLFHKYQGWYLFCLMYCLLKQNWSVKLWQCKSIYVHWYMSYPSIVMSTIMLLYDLCTIYTTSFIYSTLWCGGLKYTFYSQQYFLFMISYLENSEHDTFKTFLLLHGILHDLPNFMFFQSEYQ